MEPVVMLPSLGRPASDVDRLSISIGESGFLPVAVDPRRQFPGNPDLHDLARDTIQQLDERDISTFHLVGHAFGNRLARCITADFPERVSSLTLLAAGGLVEPPENIWSALYSCFDTSLNREDHLEAVRTAFFAPGNDPAAWSGGWMPDVMRYQRKAVTSTPREHWWTASTARVLVIQGKQDAIAPVENGRRYKAECAPHARLVEIDDAGHAMLPEQPGAIATAVVEFLRS
jgi:pimeloyl-ACP methyl ester carboxylesterase